MKQEYKIPKSFFEESQYAQKVSMELNNDAGGLIFDRYFHDIGMQLHIDVVFEKQDRDGDTWFLGGNDHVQMIVNDEQEFYLLTITALDEQGHTLLQSFNIDSIQS
ncbi:hypothetical protein [Bacillus suaedaesalsae]|uniref:Uncharacterized protein n=1 Tax=Bacillus suaedaesalsae TaxID=2810349 RepID=A0ABS2DKX3_9BACI|nr:hypothetical protein [Bacillus suaedaesalsae]MBM6618176.1 hypothetical protein [Bacillus suaedaesalsae]